MPTSPFAGNFAFFNLAQLYRPDMLAQELYDITRRAWRMDKRRHRCIDFAAGVYRGKVVAVFEVQRWHEDEASQPALKWKFDGVPATQEPQVGYVGQSAAPHMPAGVPYVVSYNFDNC